MYLQPHRTMDLDHEKGEERLVFWTFNNNLKVSLVNLIPV
jgi:hypothetical protein